MRIVCSALIAVLAAAEAGQAATTIPVVEDVMTSSFFTGTNLVRGYGVETNRPTLRVSTFNPFGTAGAETIYLSFDPAAFDSYSGPVPQALLTLQSVAGGFMADATDANPFAASAHAVNADPLVSIEKSVRDASGGNDPAALRDAAVSAVRAAVTADPAQAQEARDRAAQALAKAQGVPVDDARGQIGRYEQQYRQAIDQARKQATDAAQTATTAVSRGALFSSIALLLGAIAAWIGGRMGAVDPTITTGDLMASRRSQLH